MSTDSQAFRKLFRESRDDFGPFNESGYQMLRDFLLAEHLIMTADDAVRGSINEQRFRALRELCTGIQKAACGHEFHVVAVPVITGDFMEDLDRVLFDGYGIGSD